MSLLDHLDLSFQHPKLKSPGCPASVSGHVLGHSWLGFVSSLMVVLLDWGIVYSSIQAVHFMRSSCKWCVKLWIWKPVFVPIDILQPFPESPFQPPSLTHGRSALLFCTSPIRGSSKKVFSWIFSDRLPAIQPAWSPGFHRLQDGTGDDCQSHLHQLHHQ